MTRYKRHFLVAVTAAISTFLLLTSATPSSAATQATTPCGYYEADGHSYWNNCANTDVTIDVGYRAVPDTGMCMTPGINEIFAIDQIVFATYMHDGC
ncbi:DUF6355 family natural product biosynthesis protein [Kitasatospora sp. NPDC004669]|uniref:DUF6355 family natural product biosynthesis protein n=1 Tax=Kitasatospora sp. NPDC004669 TaxID=3154555 RepID=UPI0033A75B14